MLQADFKHVDQQPRKATSGTVVVFQCCQAKNGRLDKRNALALVVSSQQGIKQIAPNSSPGPLCLEFFFLFAFQRQQGIAQLHHAQLANENRCGLVVRVGHGQRDAVQVD